MGYNQRNYKKNKSSLPYSHPLTLIISDSNPCDVGLHQSNGRGVDEGDAAVGIVLAHLIVTPPTRPQTEGRSGSSLVEQLRAL